MEGKSSVLREMSNRSDEDILVIGDQGQTDGNDFDLLSATTSSLSVDRTSLDPTRCWNLDQWGTNGPQLLVRYLKAVQPRSSGMRFVWNPK
jgi:hypothetical protein